jgi:hypothetical protein
MEVDEPNLTMFLIDIVEPISTKFKTLMAFENRETPRMLNEEPMLT